MEIWKLKRTKKKDKLQDVHSLKIKNFSLSKPNKGIFPDLCPYNPIIFLLKQAVKTIYNFSPKMSYFKPGIQYQPRHKDS